MGPDLSMAIGVFIMRFVTVCGPSFFMLMSVYRGGCAKVCDKCRAIFARVHGDVYLSWAVLGRGCPDVTYHGVRCVHHKIQ